MVKPFHLHNVLPMFENKMVQSLNYKLFFACLTTASVSYFTYYTLKIYFLRKKYKHIPGPPSKGLLGFYFGNLYEIKEGRRNDRILFETVSRWLDSILYFNDNGIKLNRIN